MEKIDSYYFGNPQAQAEFSQKCSKLISRLPNLFSAIVTGIDLAHKKEMSQAEMTVLALARMALEDFRQILLLCSNGETTGGVSNGSMHTCEQMKS